MLKQLLITALVALIVVMIARMKRARNHDDAAKPSASAEPSAGGISPSMMAGFIFAAVITLTATGVFWVRYQHANAIIRVEVVDTRSGSTTVYQVRRRNLGEREFTTIDGRVVSLGVSDRMERSE